MNDELLDNEFIEQEVATTKVKIEEILTKIGIQSFYEHKNGYIIAQKNDAVKVAIHYKNGKIEIKPKFPRIGNPIQAISTVVLLALVWILIFPIFPFDWVFAITGGQVISYMVFRPRIMKLKEAIQHQLIND